MNSGSRVLKKGAVYVQRWSSIRLFESFSSKFPTEVRMFLVAGPRMHRGSRI
jgi:hypothetical protein